MGNHIICDFTLFKQTRFACLRCADTFNCCSIIFKMASCSIREELVAQYPTCIDYTRISFPTVRVMLVPIPQNYSNITPRSINEDEER